MQQLQHFSLFPLKLKNRKKLKKHRLHLLNLKKQKQTRSAALGMTLSVSTLIQLSYHFINLSCDEKHFYFFHSLQLSLLEIIILYCDDESIIHTFHFSFLYIHCDAVTWIPLSFIHCDKCVTCIPLFILLSYHIIVLFIIHYVAEREQNSSFHFIIHTYIHSYYNYHYGLTCVPL